MNEIKSLIDLYRKGNDNLVLHNYLVHQFHLQNVPTYVLAQLKYILIICHHRHLKLMVLHKLVKQVETRFKVCKR